MGEQKDVLYYWEILRRRKWQIVIPPFFFAVIVLILTFIIIPVWRIDSIIQPSKLFIETETGQLVEFLITDPLQIANQINQESYDYLIAQDLSIEPTKFPEIKAENPRNTKLVHVFLNERDTDRGKKILSTLLMYLKNEMDSKTEVEIKGIENKVATNKNKISLKNLNIENRKNDIKTKENEIKTKQIDIQKTEIEKAKIDQKISSEKAKLTISKERLEKILEEMKLVKTRIDEIETQQKKVLESKEKIEAVGLLLYSNEIQQNLRYYGTLDEKLSQEKITQENLRLSIKEQEEELKSKDKEIEKLRTEIAILKTQISDIEVGINKIHNEIDEINIQIEFLNERKARVDFTEFIKEPTVSVEPVFPKRTQSTALAFIFALACSTVLAFFRETLREEKRKS